MANELQLISEADLSLISGSVLNTQQLQFLHKVTPEKYVKERPAKGGGKWRYISGGYVKKTLNLMFGFNWDFEIMEQLVMHGECIVKGRLTVRTNGCVIVKNQFGNKDIVYRKLADGESERQPLSIGNDLKSAATDALKKCASELGIGSDIYNKEEFESFIIISEEEEEDKLNELTKIYENLPKEIILSNEKNQKIAERAKEIIDKKELASYDKAIRYLKELI